MFLKSATSKFGDHSKLFSPLTEPPVCFLQLQKTFLQYIYSRFPCDFITNFMHIQLGFIILYDCAMLFANLFSPSHWTLKKRVEVEAARTAPAWTQRWTGMKCVFSSSSTQAEKVYLRLPILRKTSGHWTASASSSQFFGSSWHSDKTSKTIPWSSIFAPPNYPAEPCRSESLRIPALKPSLLRSDCLQPSLSKSSPLRLEKCALILKTCLQPGTPIQL